MQRLPTKPIYRMKFRPFRRIASRQPRQSNCYSHHPSNAYTRLNEFFSVLFIHHHTSIQAGARALFFDPRYATGTHIHPKHNTFLLFFHRHRSHTDKAHSYRTQARCIHGHLYPVGCQKIRTDADIKRTRFEFGRMSVAKSYYPTIFPCICAQRWLYSYPWWF